MVKLIASKKDIAGMNIAKFIEELGHQVVYVETDIIFDSKLDIPKDELIVSLSRHKASSGKSALTTHFVGNFSDDTKFGGEARKLGMSAPSFQKSYFRNLWGLRERVPNYDIILEATHHGSVSNENPVVFVEVGSDEEGWKDENAAKVVAEALDKTLKEEEKFGKIAIAFGGPHYPEHFSKMLIETDFAIGHVMPKYQAGNFSEEMLDQMIKNSTEEVKYCIIDWKGMKRRTEIAGMAKDKGLEIVKI